MGEERKELVNMEEVIRIFNANEYPKFHNLMLDEVTRDEITLHLELQDFMKNPYGMAHGGIYFLMQDTAAGVLSRADGRRYVTLDAHINYLRSIREGKLIAKGYMTRRGRSTCVVETTVTDEAGTLLSRATMTMYCLNPDGEEPKA